MVVADSILDRAMRILDELVKVNSPLTFTQLLRRFQFNRVTLSKILTTLCSYHLLEKTPQGYQVGIKAIILAGQCRSPHQFLSRCRPHLQHISQTCGVTTLLLKPLDTATVCLDKVIHENAPAMRAIGSVNDDNLIHPWCQINAVNQPDWNPAAFPQQLLRDFDHSNYTCPPPSPDDIAPMINAMQTGIADDHAYFITGNRRLAVGIFSPDPRQLHYYLVAGYPGDRHSDVSALAAMLKQTAPKLALFC